jgi:chromatin segregation and condensation protein Rec8/ScpA/Scc1 (kleisin family)
VHFTELVEVAQSRLEIIVIFLALLEAIKREFVSARQDQTYGEIILERLQGGAVVEENVNAAEEIAEDWS